MNSPIMRRRRFPCCRNGLRSKCSAATVPRWTFAKPREPASPLSLASTACSVMSPVALTRCNNCSPLLNQRAIATPISSAWAAIASPFEMRSGYALLFPIALLAFASVSAEAESPPLYRRLRYEYFHNPQWGLAPQDDNGYWLQRYMLHADAHFTDWFRTFIQFKSGLETDRKGGPRPTDRDEADLHQAFFDLRVPLQETNSLTLRIGRQELAYGSSRLISVREGPNVRQSFDGVKVIAELGRTRIDAFAVKPVETKPGVFDDGPEPGEKFWGIYGVTPLPFLRGANVDLYYLGLERKDTEFDQGTARELRHTLGTRLWGKTQQIDYNFEFVYQFGSFGKADISAWTVASDTGYTFESMLWKPRIGFKADITSGDRNPNDRDLETFNPLFPPALISARPL